MADNLFSTINQGEPLEKAEQHLHTNFTDGENSPEEMIKAAINLGLSRIVFTEHVQKKSDWYPDFARQIESLKKEYGRQIQIILGLEAKQINLQGDIDANSEQKKLAQIIIGSVHGYCREKELDFFSFKEISPAKALKMEWSQIKHLIKNHEKSGLNVIGHPFGVYIREYKKTVPIEYWEKCIKEISGSGLAFDLNYLYHREYFFEIVKLLIKYQTLVNIGSDAHRAAEVGLGSAYLQKILLKQTK